jgi:hypothetical protein
MPVSPKNLFISESRVFLTDYGVILSWLLSDAYPILRIPDKLGTSAPRFSTHADYIKFSNQYYVYTLEHILI